MKKVLLIIIATLFVVITYAQNDQYQNAMSSALAKMEQSKSVADFQTAANSFNRIAQVATSEWLPYYYVAYSNMTAAWLSLEKEAYDDYDQYIKAAQKAIETAKEASNDEPEVYIMEAYIFQAKIMRNPMINGARYASTIETLLNQAKVLDPENPRAYYLMGQQLLNMPAFFGGGKDKALPEFESAAKKFDKYALVSTIHPNWGAKANASILSRIKG